MAAAEDVGFVAARDLGDGAPTHWACARANARLGTPARYAFYMKRVVSATVDEAIRSFCKTNRTHFVHLTGPALSLLLQANIISIDFIDLCSHHHHGWA